MRAAFLAILVTVSVLWPGPRGWAGQGASRIIPMEDFFRNPEKAGYQISPDGRFLAFLAPWRNRLNVHVQPVGQKGLGQAVRVTASRDRDITTFLWKGNEHLVYFLDRGGDENHHAYALRRDGTGLRDLTPFKGAKATLVDELEDVPNRILVGLNRRDPTVFDVYRADIRTGTLTLAARNPGNVEDWMADNAGRIRLAVAKDGLTTTVLHRRTDKEPFLPVMRTDFRDEFAPLHFTPDDRNIYVASNLGRDKAAIYEFDLEAKQQGRLLFEHPDVDVHELLRSRKTRQAIGVTYELERREIRYFPEEWRELQSSLEERLPGREVVVTDTSRDDRRLIISALSDRSRGATYYLDRDSGDFLKLADVSPWLREDELAEMKPVSYPSRDGLTIRGYLTLPKGVEPRNLPVVVNPHGGPWVRDEWGFDPEVQFLANRGYAVLQMNFRGSTGYGRSFWEAGFKQWGRAMQDDVTDGVDWLVRQGIADPQRVAIYGGSYGGYAALAGLTFTPEVYACGVDLAGPSNLFTLLATLPPYWTLGKVEMYEMVGDPDKDKDLLTAASPFFHADRIARPLFVAQGTNDPRVKQAEADQIVGALKRRGVEVEYMLKQDEGHGFLKEEDRFAFYRAMEAFFRRHLSP